MKSSQPRRSDLLRAAGVAILFALVAAVAPTPAPAQTGPIEDLAAFPLDKLQILDGKKVKYVFEVWLADSPSRQSQGLMFVRDLPDLRGMLFIHDQPQAITMWMKNTYIPLDMVFIDAKNHIQEIHANAVPHSLDIISPNKPARAVLEIAGGEAKRLGLHPGQLVTHPALVSH